MDIALWISSKIKYWAGVAAFIVVGKLIAMILRAGPYIK
jgi:hypothetical protein